MKELPKCIQCGQCCKEVICAVGKIIYGSDIPPCNGLLKIDNKYFCQVVLVETLAFKEKEKRLVCKGMGIGKGCCNYEKTGIYIK